MGLQVSWVGTRGLGPRGAGVGQPRALTSEVSADHGVRVTGGRCKSIPDILRALGLLSQALGLRSVVTIGREVQGEESVE